MGRLNQLAVSPAVTHLAAFASALPGGLARPWKTRKSFAVSPAVIAILTFHPSVKMFAVFPLHVTIPYFALQSHAQKRVAMA